MKKQWIVLCLGLALAVSAQAAEKKTPLVQQISGQGYGMAGCGLGSILFGEQPGMIQVIAATLNGFWGTQTFGISSGTSNCDAYAGDSRSASIFIDANRDALEKDIARGSGETLENLAGIIGCSNPGLLGTRLQSKYETIFRADNSGHVADAILNTVTTDQSLAATCGTTG